jgi:MFS family permease
MNPAWKNRNLQLYFSGQVVSLIGTWMQQMALSWLIYRLTNSPFMLGLIGFASQAPSLLVTPFAGIIADRANRHRLLLTTQALAMVQAALLAALVLSGQTQLWQLVALSAMLGIITAFDMPTRQTFMVDMLDDKEQLASAIGISSSINTSTRLIGPFLAGLFVAWAGEGICFLANAISYVAVIVALLFVKSNQRPKSPSQKGSVSQLKEGFAYAIGFTPIRDLIMLLALLGLFAMPFAILMPAFAKDVFHGNASTLGFLSGASGAGSVVGALFLTSRKGTRELSRWIIIGCALFGLGLIAFGSSTLLPLSLLVVAIVGFASMLVMAGSMTVIQTIVDEDKRGRVMSLVIMAFMGLSPFGCMAAGALANVIGVGKTVMATGIITVILALIFCTRILRIHLKVTPVQVNEGIREADSEMAAMKA